MRTVHVQTVERATAEPMATAISPPARLTAQ